MARLELDWITRLNLEGPGGHRAFFALLVDSITGNEEGKNESALWIFFPIRVVATVHLTLLIQSASFSCQG